MRERLKIEKERGKIKKMMIKKESEREIGREKERERKIGRERV